MRIDSARNQIEATRELLGLSLLELETLYVLSYERSVAGDEVKVAGGERDYALDTHGDARIRDAYQAFTDQLVSSSRDMADSGRDLLRYLRAYVKGTKTGPRTTTAIEYAGLLEAKARRAARGEYQPHQPMPQPARDDALTSVTRELQRVQRLNRRLIKDLADATGTSVKTLTEQYDPAEDAVA